jgi:dihydroorotate dehydrogenase
MWKSLLRPLFFLLPAETAHHLSMKVFTFFMSINVFRHWVERAFHYESPRLRTNVAGVELENPLGLAAGFDKDGKWFEELPALGFGFIEIGTVTGEPQGGNPRPRLFRLPKDKALINRMGFNNDGAEAAERRVRHRSDDLVLGINIGKSKVVPNERAVEDYLKSFHLLADYADYVVVNVSSPNTPGLRELQASEPLKKLLSQLADANRELAAERGSSPKPIFVKLAPDLHMDAALEAVDIARECGLAGIIATNTTNSRDDLETSAARIDEIGAGGLSGQPLTVRSRAFVAKLYERAAGDLPIIGVGGVMSPEDAWQMILHGASAVQVYTGFIYGGPGFVRDILEYVDARLEERGVTSVAEVVGSALDERPAEQGSQQVAQG